MFNSLFRRWRGTLPALALSVSLAACGGGSADGVGSGGTGSYSSGTITGFGSIIVNGVRYDDSTAVVVDAAGNTRSSSDLHLGMVVEIEASAIQTDAATGRRSATATKISYGSEIEGPVDAIDAAANQLSVLGQVVQLNASTVFDDDLRGGLAALQVGQIVEINGYFTSAGHYAATRIDREDDDESSYELRGPVAALDAAAQTLQIGGATIALGSAPAVPTLAVGDFVRVDLAKTRNPAGQWVAVRVVKASLTQGDGSTGNAGASSNRDEAELEGFITQFTSAASFSVNGVPVDASAVTNPPAGLAAGVRVEVEGRLVDGRLIARKIELEDGDSRDDGIEIDGTIEAFNAAARTFVIRGVTVQYDDTVRFEDGSAANLRDGARVEVEGRLAADGVTVVATRIDFET